MSEPEKKVTECANCGGQLVDYDDYVAGWSVRLGAAAAVGAAIACAVWAPVFFLVRLGIGGALGAAGGGVLAGLLVKKIGVGIILGVLIGAGVGIGKKDIGIFLGAVIGALGGFFIAAADAMPLQADAAHRLDIVLVSVIAGILCALTAGWATGFAQNKFRSWVGPEPVEDSRERD